jgi:hypothetical protein
MRGGRVFGKFQRIFSRAMASKAALTAKSPGAPKMKTLRGELRHLRFNGYSSNLFIWRFL